MAEEFPSTDIITLTRHILGEQFRLGPLATGDLTLLLTAIQTTSKFIATNVRKARLINLIGLAGETNVQGEEQKKLDVLSNDIMVNALRASRKTAVLVSEELDDAIIIEERLRGRYCVVFDPLDGSSNIDAGVNIGTIFGIYRCQSENGDISDVLRPGSEMVAAGYTMYGSSCNLVLSTGNGVNGYTLDTALGEFILTHPNIKIPPRGKIYSFNEGNSCYFHPPVIEYLNSIKYPSSTSSSPKAPYSARYIGSMVADVHRTLLYGGIFGYPDDSKSKSGKLRLLYEAFPMAYLTEQAGGVATTGRGRILDVVPKSIHERCPVFLGSKDDVNDLLKIYEKHEKEGKLNGIVGNNDNSAGACPKLFLSYHLPFDSDLVLTIRNITNMSMSMNTFLRQCSASISSSVSAAAAARRSTTLPALRSYSQAASSRCAGATVSYRDRRRMYSTDTKEEDTKHSENAESSNKNEGENGNGKEKKEDTGDLLECQEKLKAKENECVDLTSRLRYLQADFLNLQRNAAREKEQTKDFAISRFAGDLLETVDVLSLALKSVPESALKVESSPSPEESSSSSPDSPTTSDSTSSKSASEYLKELHLGVDMTHRLLLQTLFKYGVKPFDPTGEQFDPNRHEALYQAPVPGKTPGTVIQCQKTGFLIKDRTLRAAQVGVAAESS